MIFMKSTTMNIIQAIRHFIQHPTIDLAPSSEGNNRANLAGAALENYIKNLFAGALDCSKSEQMQKQSQVFSYLGNANNPPDAMLRQGDAIEIKKIENAGSSLALNSSYPKAKLFANDPMIAEACRKAEDWQEKDLIYCVGVVKAQKLSRLAMVYGEDFCADAACYQKIKDTIKDGVARISQVEFAETRELGRINHIDPLGATYLRVRGMWHIKNPWQIFDYLLPPQRGSFQWMVLINERKWHSFDNREALLTIQDERLSISDVQIRNPNNPAQLKAAKFMIYEF